MNFMLQRNTFDLQVCAMDDCEAVSPLPQRDHLRACAIFMISLCFTTIFWGTSLVYIGCAYNEPGETLQPFSTALLVVGFILISAGFLSTSGFAYFFSLYLAASSTEQTKMK
jgi:hypothetical protein